jgi:hypothetical protein
MTILTPVLQTILRQWKGTAMKRIFSFLLLLLSHCIAMADDSTCQKEYGQRVAQCAKGLDFLSPNIRAGAQKACVQDAKVARDACTSGINTCVNDCQTVYNNTVTVCEQTYNPAICSGNPTCEQVVLQQRSDCISAAVDTLNACTAACPQL